jgi:hypothetical protein
MEDGRGKKVRGTKRERGDGESGAGNWKGKGAGVYFLLNTPPRGGVEISANVIWGKKYEKAKRKKGKM